MLNKKVLRSKLMMAIGPSVMPTTNLYCKMMKNMEYFFQILINFRIQMLRWCPNFILSKRVKEVDHGVSWKIQESRFFYSRRPGSQYARGFRYSIAHIRSLTIGEWSI